MGNVTYKQLGRLLSGVSRFTPAANVLVTITNFFDGSKHYQTTTDGSGNYGVNVPDGLYSIQVSDNNNTFFVPPFKVVKVKGSTKNADFEGLLFPSF